MGNLVWGAERNNLTNLRQNHRTMVPLHGSSINRTVPLATLDTDFCFHQASSGKLFDKQVREPVSKIDRPWVGAALLKMIGKLNVTRRMIGQ